jgi:hypothetical protein
MGVRARSVRADQADLAAASAVVRQVAGSAGITGHPAQYPPPVAQRPDGGPLQYTAEVWPVRGHGHHGKGCDRKRAGGCGCRQDHDVPRRQPASGQDKGTR